MVKGILYLHGFSGGTYEVAPLHQFISEREQFDVEMPTYPGHGEYLHMNNMKAEYWIQEAELAYRRLAKRVTEVIVVGFSMGGVIALYLAKRYRVAKLILLSAALDYIEPRQLIMDMAIFATPKYRAQMNDVYERYAFKFGRVTVTHATQFIKVVQKTMPYVHQITTPLFIVQGKLDGMVPYTTASKIYYQVASTEKGMYLSEQGKHHICFSSDREQWFEKVLKFILQKSDY